MGRRSRGPSTKTARARGSSPSTADGPSATWSGNCTTRGRHDREPRTWLPTARHHAQFDRLRDAPGLRRRGGQLPVRLVERRRSALRLGADGPTARRLWPVEVDRDLTGSRAERLYDVYLECFGRCAPGPRPGTSSRAAEFLDEMSDPRIVKYTVWRSEGEPVALATVTNDLEAVTWVSPDFFAARYPRARGSWRDLLPRDGVGRPAAGPVPASRTGGPATGRRLRRRPWRARLRRLRVQRLDRAVSGGGPRLPARIAPVRVGRGRYPDLLRGPLRLIGAWRGASDGLHWCHVAAVRSRAAGIRRLPPVPAPRAIPCRPARWACRLHPRLEYSTPYPTRCRCLRLPRPAG